MTTRRYGFPFRHSWAGSPPERQAIVVRSADPVCSERLLRMLLSTAARSDVQSNWCGFPSIDGPAVLRVPPAAGMESLRPDGGTKKRTRRQYTGAA